MMAGLIGVLLQVAMDASPAKFTDLQGRPFMGD
jgi:hypothetical protein